MSSLIYSAAPICQNLPIYNQITNDLKKEYKNILEKHLDGRIITENKINSWMNNILIEAKSYFTSKYPDYDLFLYITVCQKKFIFGPNLIQYHYQTLIGVILRNLQQMIYVVLYIFSFINIII